MPVSSSGVVGCCQRCGAEYGDKEKLDCWGCTGWSQARQESGGVVTYQVFRELR